MDFGAVCDDFHVRNPSPYLDTSVSPTHLHPCVALALFASSEQKQRQVHVIINAACNVKEKKEAGKGNSAGADAQLLNEFGFE